MFRYNVRNELFQCMKNTSRFGKVIYYCISLVSSHFFRLKECNFNNQDVN